MPDTVTTAANSRDPTTGQPPSDLARRAKMLKAVQHWAKVATDASVPLDVANIARDRALVAITLTYPGLPGEDVSALLNRAISAPPGQETDFSDFFAAGLRGDQLRQWIREEIAEPAAAPTWLDLMPRRRVEVPGIGSPVDQDGADQGGDLAQATIESELDDRVPPSQEGSYPLSPAAILQEIVRLTQENERLTQTIRENERLERIQRRLRSELLREPTPDEIGLGMDLPGERVREIIQQARNQPGRNAAQRDRLVHSVTVIDPRHPLYGQILPLVCSISPRGKEHLILRLPDGQPRSVPRAATNLDAVSPPTDPRSLPVISVRTILPVARLVRSKMTAAQEVSRALAPDCTADPAGPLGAGFAADALESPRARSAAGPRPAPGPADPTSARPASGRGRGNR